MLGIASRSFDLPGSGADPTPREAVTLDAYVAAVVAQIDAAPASQVVLVGHSIAGWLLPAAAAARGERVAELVFVAAAVLNSGERGIDATPSSRRGSYFEMAAASDDRALLPSFGDARQRFFGMLGEEVAENMYRRLTPQPLAPYLDLVPVGIEEVTIPRRYIAATHDLTYPEPVTAAFAAKAGVAPVVVAGDHDVMLSNPAGLAAALVADSPVVRGSTGATG